MSTRSSSSNAARFFDRTSTNYRAKYTHASPFHHYYFNERLDKATRELELGGKKVLDIGSGTGNLYDHLLPCFPGMRFFATDVSAGMLSQSLVPEADRYVGFAYDHGFAQRTFDAIFMLGVTTYMDAAELERNLAFIAKSLSPGGQAIITFTHSGGLDTWMRWLLKLPPAPVRQPRQGPELRRAHSDLWHCASERGARTAPGDRPAGVPQPHGLPLRPCASGSFHRTGQAH